MPDKKNEDQPATRRSGHSAGCGGRPEQTVRRISALQGREANGAAEHAFSRSHISMK